MALGTWGDGEGGEEERGGGGGVRMGREIGVNWLSVLQRLLMQS